MTTHGSATVVVKERSLLDWMAKVAFIAACVTLTGVALLQYHRGRTPDVPDAQENVFVGLKLGTPWPQERPTRTVLVYVSSGCRYCEASIPFYSRLIERASRSDGRWTVAFVARDRVDATTSFLAAKGVTGTVLPAVPAGLPARATPLLAIIDSAGVMESSWVGQLSSRQESKVLAAIQ
jgi:hypothetical protein